MKLVSSNPEKGSDNRITLNGLISFYQGLVRNGRIKVGSAGYRRMTDLIDKSNRLLKYKRLRYGANYGTETRLDAGTTK